MTRSSQSVARRFTVRATTAATALCLAASFQGLHAQNLLLNPSFESGLASWTVVSGNASVVSYGSFEVASTQVSDWIGGGGQLLREGSNNGFVVEQVVNVGALPANTHVRAGGYFGGFSDAADQARLVLRFLNAAGGEISRFNLPYVSATNRNNETVLMLRSTLLAPPAGTERIAARIETQNLWCCTGWATADNLFLELTTTPLTPAALPLDAELLTNPNFEQGWSSSSPLTLRDAQSWEGQLGVTRTSQYSNSDPLVPTTTVAAIVGGGSRLLAQAVNNNCLLRQRLDVRGNAAQIAAGLELNLSGYFGGVGDSTDNAGLEVTFLDANFLPLGNTAPERGPVTVGHRNGQTLVMRRELKALLPAGTSYLDVDIKITESYCCAPSALADRLSAKLRTPSALAKLQLNTNLVNNGSFEEGDLAGSPLQLNNPNSWVGETDDALFVDAYGITNGTTPGTAFAISNGLGGTLARGIDDARFTQRFSLAGYDTAIQQGRLFLDSVAWLGGHSNTTDDARLNVRFFSQFNAQVGVTETLGPVTAADRANLTTLLRRNSTRQVPSGAVRFEVELEYRDNWCCQDFALADGIDVSLRDTAQPGLTYCTSTINSTGATALMSATGGTSIGVNNLVLRASPVQPNTAGLFFYGTSRTQAPFGNGIRCIAPPLTRFPVVNANNNGVLAFPVNYAASQITAGATFQFQAWYRDAPAGGATFNTSDGYELTFLP